jgi:hypothetical protein
VIDHRVETIAAVLAGLPSETKQRLLVDAFKHALTARPELHEHELDPRVVDLITDIFARVAQIEQERRRACSH